MLIYVRDSSLAFNKIIMLKYIKNTHFCVTYGSK